MVDQIKKSGIFRDCTDEELAELASISRQVIAAAGTCIFKAESPAEHLYVVIAGAVDLRFTVTHFNAAKEITLNRKFDGEAFGWSAFTKPGKYTLSAFAAKETRLLKIKESELKRLCAANNHLGYLLMSNIVEIVGERFAAIQKTLIEIVQQNLDQKEL